MVARDQIKALLDLASSDSEVWGSDDCGCDDCAKKRRRVRLKLVRNLVSVLAKVNV